MRKILGFVSVMLTTLLVGCGGTSNQSAEVEAKGDYAENGVYIKYQADSRLNMVNQQSHSLVLVIYQLTGVNGFNAFVSYKDGLVKLLSAEAFDKTVTSVTKKYIEPGSGGVISLPRAAHTEHVAIVAGYYDLNPKKASALFDITYDTSRHGFLLLKKSTTVNLLDVILILGEDGMRVENYNES